MIDVTCAIIRNEDDEVLIVQRGEKTDHPFKWEFPGGKTAMNESHEDCIIREVSEELSMDLVICRRMEAVEFDYGNKQIRLIPFVCDTLDELPVLSEHIDFKWVDAGELKGVDFSGADIIVARQYLAEGEAQNALTEKSSGGNPQDLADDSELRDMVNSMMSRQEAEWLANSSIEIPAIFNKLIEYSYSEERKLAFRASWTLSKACDRYPEMIYPHLSRMVESITSINNESVQRSFLRIISLSRMEDLSGRHHGILADHCFSMLRSGQAAIAIKAFSMDIIYKLAVLYPELSGELASTLSLLMNDPSGGIVARAKIILKKLSQAT